MLQLRSINNYFEAWKCDKQNKLPVEEADGTFAILSEPCWVNVTVVITSWRGELVLAKLLRGESSLGSSTETNK